MKRRDRQKKKFQDRRLAVQGVKIQRLQKQMGALKDRLESLEKPSARKKRDD